jgi:hypothetical protein
MNFISYNNLVELDYIDFKSDSIGIIYNGHFLTYKWTGSCWFRNDFDDLVGAYVDSDHNIKLALSSEYSDDIDDNTLSALEDDREFIIEHIVQQTYDREMKNRG